MTLRRTAALASCLGVVALGSLTACGQDEVGTTTNPDASTVGPASPSSGSSESTEPSTGATPSGSASDGATDSATEESGNTIRVTFAGDTVTPNGERVEVAAGQDVRLLVTADEPGEIHVHSTPEQELDYPSGQSELTIKDLDQPGIVEVESHALDKVIVQLQVQ